MNINNQSSSDVTLEKEEKMKNDGLMKETVVDSGYVCVEYPDLQFTKNSKNKPLQKVHINFFMHRENCEKYKKDYIEMLYPVAGFKAYFADDYLKNLSSPSADKLSSSDFLFSAIYQQFRNKDLNKVTIDDICEYYVNLMEASFKVIKVDILQDIYGNKRYVTRNDKELIEVKL